MKLIFRGTCRALIDSGVVYDFGYPLPGIVFLHTGFDTSDNLRMLNFDSGDFDINTALDAMHSAWAGELDTWGVEVHVIASPVLGIEVVRISMTGRWEHSTLAPVPYIP